MADKKRMKGITYCGECVYYNHHKHKCELGAKEESNPKDPFYDDCPIPDIEQINEQEIRNKAIDEFVSRLEKHEQENWIDHHEYGITWSDIEMIAEQMKGGAE